MTLLANLLSVSWEDVYEYLRCPKILSYRAYEALMIGPYIQFRQTRRTALDNGEDAWGFEDEAAYEVRQHGMLSEAEFQEPVARTQDELDSYLKHVVDTSLKGSEDVSEVLRREYGKIEILARAEARHPDLACVARPSYVAFTSNRSRPIAAIVKNSNAKSRKDEFKAKFINGLTDASGLFVIEQRLENAAPRLDSYVSKGQAETVLVHPHSHKVVREKFVVDIELAKKVALAKQLGYRGMSPETDCGPHCPHNRCRVILRRGDEETLRPLPLIVGEGLLKKRFDLDTYYQIYYGWGILREQYQYFPDFQETERSSWRGWLLDTVCLGGKAADFLARNPHTYNPWVVGAETMLKHLGHEGDSWRKIFKHRLKSAATTLLGKTKSVYALPTGSSEFLRGAIKRWL